MSGQLRNANAHDVQAFPGSVYVATGTVPKPQCTDSKFEGKHGITDGIGTVFRDDGQFTLDPLVGANLNITSPPANVGIYSLIFNSLDVVISTLAYPVASNDNVYFISDHPNAEKQQTAEEIMQIASQQGAATMRKGGQVFIDGSADQVNEACTLQFDPE